MGQKNLSDAQGRGHGQDENDQGFILPIANQCKFSFNGNEDAGGRGGQLLLRVGEVRV